MKWEHTCNVLWLEARQKYLCASEVRKLIPVTESGKPRKITDDDRIKVLAGKRKILTLDDCVSVGAAARGHIMEPYAVELFNEEVGYAIEEEFHHWDDVLIHNPRSSAGDILAFSPDALTVPQGSIVQIGRQVEADCFGFPGSYNMLEIKSYSPERHMAAGFSDPMKLEERWQIATAMAVDPMLLEAWIAFYNPDMEDRLFAFNFSRVDLDAEIILIREAAAEWKMFLDKIDSGSISSMATHHCSDGGIEYQDKVYDSIVDKMEGGLNP